MMAKYKLKMKELDFKNTLEFEADGIEDVLANIEIFLRGNGFFFDGALDIHEGEVKMNSMHATSYRITTDRDFDDIVTQDEDLNVEIEDGNNAGG